MAAAQKRPAGAAPSTPALVPPTPSGQHAHDRLCLLLLVLVGQTVVATLKGGVRVQGVLSAATTDGEVSIALRHAVDLASADSTPKPSLIINARDLVEVEAADVALDSIASTSSAATAKPNQDSFRTDTDISGLPPPSRPRERDLQAWSAGAEAWGAGGIEDAAANGIGALSLDDDFSKSTNGKPRGGPAAGGGGGWDQFAANERMYGLKTDYNEEIYTTKLDRNTKDFKDREARAAQLEREILKGSSSLASNAHMAEERGEQVDDDNVNEEDRYGAVQRTAGAYVPPGARKAALARLGGGGTSPTPPSTNGSSVPPAPSPNSSAQLSAQAAVPGSRIPPTVRLPGSASTPGGPTSSKSHPPVDETFRDFVREEKERLEKKKAILLQQQAKAEKDSRLRSLVQFSQSFKNPYPITDEIANMMHGKSSTGVDASATKASSTTVSPAAAPRQLPPTTATNGAKLAPPSSAVPAQPTKGPASAAKKSLLLADIPPFNPAKAAARQAELAAQKAAKEGGAGVSAASPSPAPSTLTPQAPKSKISATAAPFVFKPNPNATSFTPGSSTIARKPSIAAGPSSPAPSPKPQPQIVPVASGSSQPAAAPNPFFGTKPLKRAGSSSLNVKEDFTPFRLNAVLPEPGQAVPSWPFTGKPYRSMYPPQATPLSLADEQAAYQNAIAAQQAAMVGGPGPGGGGLDPSISPGPQGLLPSHHPHHHAMPPGSAAAAVAMGMPFPGMHPQQQPMAINPAAVQAAMAAGLGQSQGGGGGGARQMYPQMAANNGGLGSGHPPPPHARQQQQPPQGGGGGGGHVPNHAHVQHQHHHHQQQQQQQQQFVPPPYHLQQAMAMGQFGVPPPGQQHQGGGGNPHMYTSPSMQPQPTPPPPGAGIAPHPSPRYAPYHPYAVQPGNNGPAPPPPPGSVPPQGFVPQQQQQQQQ
ncbi:hypothetical protein JCM11491_006013 [Sporobolomyces phaffii]